jgi:hypothetical protein
MEASVNVLGEIHTWIGYAVFLVVLVVAFMAFGRAKDAREFTAGPYKVALILLDVQVLLGLVTYAVGGFWDARPEIAYVHPVLALLALAVGHGMFGKAKSHTLAADAHRGAGRALLAATVLILLAIGVASAPAFL